MNETSALSKIEPIDWAIPQVDSSLLPAKVSKRLWVTPSEFMETISVWQLAD